MTYGKTVRMQNQAKRRLKPKGYALHTYLEPVSAGVLAALSARDNPSRPAAHRTLERQQREELERLCPGAWDVVADMALDPSETPREHAARVAKQVTELLRARVL